MSRKKRKGILASDEKLALMCILIFHLAGFLLLTFSKGFIFSIALDFVPVNLIMTTLIVLKFQPDFNRNFWIFAIYSVMAGFIVEIIGVNSGLIFGHYEYGEVLGPTLLNTPYLIGLNWFLLSYLALSATDFLPASTWIKFFVSIAILVGFDYLMEPAAIRLGFWSWKNNLIPIQNYIGWAGTALLIMALEQLNRFSRKNRVAAWTLLIQAGFFLLLKVF